ncbi:MAG: hypothetical protein ACFFDH_13065 [Promethearchaeota archaeon]
MIDYYNEILNFFEYSISRKTEDPIWINKKIIEISENCVNQVSKKEYIDYLILIQNLFMTDIPDHYHRKGKLIKFLNPEECKVFKKILKEEFST